MSLDRLFNHPEALPLWPEVLPIAPDRMDDLRHTYRPCLLPCLMPDSELRPLVIVCPGGGYSHHAAHEGLPVARLLNGLGLHAAVLGYRVTPFRDPAPLLDAQRAIRLVRSRASEWQVDVTKVGILGFSAGGHVAVSAGVLHARPLPHPVDALAGYSSRPDAVIGCYPVVSMGPTGHAGSRDNLLGVKAGPERIAALSLERQVDATCPPMFLWHTAEDAGVPVANSLHLAAALCAAGVPVDLHVFSRGRHGLGLAEGLPAGAWTRLLADWFTDLGWRS